MVVVVTATGLGADIYPARVPLEWDLVDERAVLALPKRMGRFERLVARVLPGPEVVFVTLDDLGTAAWLAADGETRIADAAARLEAAFGARAAPSAERATAFYVDLGRRGLVRLLRTPERVGDPGRGFTAERGYRRVVCPRCQHENAMKGLRGIRYVCPSCRRVTRA
ncbi:MAG: PqqD family peptide modification chaperone [Thermoplasmatota archaeon]